MINLKMFTNRDEMAYMDFDAIKKSNEYDVLSSANVAKFVADIDMSIEKAESDENREEKLAEITKAKEDFSTFSQVTVLKADLSKETFFIRKKIASAE